jgi:2-oxoglutarate dehydrogenase E2 component (dihydrolipoamide succinyltransferase)
LVRKIAEEHNIDISRISGSGASGRVTKDDIMSFIASGAALTPQQAVATAKTGAALPAVADAAIPFTQVQTSPQQFTAAPPAQPQTQLQTAGTQLTQIQTSTIGDRVEPMSVMRKKIAQHMTMSKQTSAHVASVYEIDMTNVVKFRDKNKDAFAQRYNTKLTFMPFIFQAVTSALRKFPIVNSQVSGENIVYKGDVKLGMAVALDWGLIVPVIKRADTLSLAGLALAANDLAERARSKKLVPDEVAGGTFTITNPGVFGGLFGTPIINQPQVAILCVGTIEKRPKVITSADGEDYIAIRHMAYFALTYDHRVVDGADAEKFLSFVKETLESGQFVL